MNACEINLEYRYHTRAIQRKVILSHELFQDLVLFSSTKFCAHTRAQNNVSGPDKSSWGTAEKLQSRGAAGTQISASPSAADGQRDEPERKGE